MGDMRHDDKGHIPYECANTQLVYLVTAAEVVLTGSMSLVGSKFVPTRRLRPILLHTDAMLQSQ